MCRTQVSPKHMACPSRLRAQSPAKACSALRADPGASALLVAVVLTVAALLLMGVALAVNVPRAGAHGSVWIRVADCESGDGDGKPPYRASWSYNGSFDGGLQFLPSTWRLAVRLPAVRAVALRYAFAYQAPAWVQIRVAQAWLAVTSWAQWPVCSRKLRLR